MDLNQLIHASISDSKASLWPAFAPELVLCATLLLMLLVKTFRLGRWVHGFWITVVGAGIALYGVFLPLQTLPAGEALARTELFTGMLVHDPFSVGIRALLLLFVVLFAIFTRVSGIPDKYESVNFYTLVLGSTLGMCLMASANHLMIVFLAVEMASVPSYVLAAMLKGRRESSEAALKYAVYGAGAAGVMLYGISLIAGLLGTCHLPTLAAELAQQLPSMDIDQKLVLVLGGVMMLVGVAFKLSAVPFHFWCPDVFEGASAEVDALLSVASKAAALALLVRICLGFGLVPQVSTSSIEAPIGAVTATGHSTQQVHASLLAVADSVSLADQNRSSSTANPRPTPGTAFTRTTSTGSPAAVSPLASVRGFAAMLIVIISAITCTFGNLAAYGQTNIKRLLAYSTIAHAGYMMMPIPVALVLADKDAAGAQRAIAAIVIYLVIYLFMNLGAFAMVAFLRNWLHSEEIADYAGMAHRHPMLVVCFATMLVSLVGIPPVAGFVGKFAVFASLADGYLTSGQTSLLLLLVIGGFNTVISLFYYMRVIKVMVMDPESDRVATTRFSTWSVPGLYLVLITLPLVVLFLSWNVLNEWTLAATTHLF